MDWGKIINIIKKTGDKLIIVDSAEQHEPLVLMDLAQYEQLLGVGEKSLTDANLVDKINRDIDAWQKQPRANNGQITKEPDPDAISELGWYSPESEISEDDSVEEATPPKTIESAFSSVGSILEKKNPIIRQINLNKSKNN